MNDIFRTLDRDYDLGSDGLPLPDGRRISLLPAKTGEIAGFPLYDDQLLILTKGSRPVWVPVTREQYLAAPIRFRGDEPARAEQRAAQPGPYQEWASKRQERSKAQQQRYQQMKAVDPAKAEELLRQARRMEAEVEAGLKASESLFAGVLESLKPFRDAFAALRAELAGMPADKRASKAWWTGPLGDPRSGLVPAGTPEARPLIAVNPDFFDQSRPQVDWQLITVRFYSKGLSEQHIGLKRLYEFRATVDWRRLAALIEWGGPAS